MRIDKYLWCTRYFKTRNIASNACKKGQVKVNDSVVKRLEKFTQWIKSLVRKNQINYQLTVLDVPKSRVGAKLVDIYRKDITPKEAFKKDELLKFAKRLLPQKKVLVDQRRKIGVKLKDIGILPIQTRKNSLTFSTKKLYILVYL